MIIFWLDELATKQVGEAWSNMVGFYLYHMLAAFLNENFDPYEHHQNIVIGATEAVFNSRTGVRSSTVTSDDARISTFYDQKNHSNSNPSTEQVSALSTQQLS